MNAGKQRAASPRAWAIAASIVMLVAFVVFGLPRVMERIRPPIHHSKTNVLMLTLCTLRADHLASYGYQRHVSPNLDRLATQGFRFERVLAHAPWTKPATAAIITGMFPRSLNIEDPESDENYRLLHDGFTTLAEVMKDHGYYTIGITANPNTAAVFNMDQGYDWYQDPELLWQDAYMKKGVWSSETVFSLFIEHLRGRPLGEKFFAHLVVIDVHAPRDHKLATEPGDQFEIPPPGQRSPVDLYDLQISFMDKNIGWLLNALEGPGYADDLLVVVNSDHGEGLGDRSRRDWGHSRMVHNSTIWVPWIVHHPDLEPVARSRAAMVQQIDMLPTILDLLGIDKSRAAGGLTAIAGTSRASDILGPQPSPAVASSVVRTQFRGADKAAVVTPEYKLIINFDHQKKMPSRLVDEQTETYEFPPALELYRYREDLLENNNLSAEEPAVANDLKLLFRQWQRSYPPLVSADELNVSRSEASEQHEALKALGYIGDG